MNKIKRFVASFFQCNSATCPTILCLIADTFFPFSGSLSVSRNEVLWYISRKFYRVVFRSVPVAANILPSPGSIAVASYNFFEGAFLIRVSFSVACPYVLQFHCMSCRRILRTFPTIWRSVLSVTNPVYRHFIVNSVLVDDDCFWLDFHYLVRTRRPKL